MRIKKLEGTIIIADDDVSVRTVLSQAVSRAGCRVKSTGAISTLWRWVEEGEGDAVILDVLLPDGDALDILPALYQKVLENTHKRQTHLHELLLI